MTKITLVREREFGCYLRTYSVVEIRGQITVFDKCNTEIRVGNSITEKQAKELAECSKYEVVVKKG